MEHYKFLRTKDIILLFIGVSLMCTPLLAQDGEALFNANCASCHKIDKDYVGPALKGAEERWVENSSEEALYSWIKNSQSVIKSGDNYAQKLFADWNKSIMPPQVLSTEEIDAILEYVESGAGSGGADSGSADNIAQDEMGGDEDSSDFSWVVFFILLLLIVLVFSLISVRVQLKSVLLENESGELPDEVSFMARTKKWLSKNKGVTGVLGFVLLLIVGVKFLLVLMGVGVQEGYKPSQPIAFSHAVHAGQNEISCVYCHNSVEKSKSAGIPTVNVCMNCHKAVSEGTETGTSEISKIYEASGWNVDEFKYTGKTKPIKWVKVHNLPDHVYFNHSQHVKVGEIECEQCHGDMTKETVAKIQTVEDLNKVEGNIQLTRPTLTMGWCLECHAEKGIQVKGGTDYYEEIHKRLLNDKELYKKYIDDEKITVSELGGWECSKCHY